MTLCGFQDGAFYRLLNLAITRSQRTVRDQRKLRGCSKIEGDEPFDMMVTMARSLRAQGWSFVFASRQLGNRQPQRL